MPPTLDLRRLAIAPLPRDGSSRPHQIAARIREKYLRGSLAPGERVPSERELAAALQVSRTALREGLRILEAEGLIDIVHGRGTFVVDTSAPGTAARTAPGATIVSKEILDLTSVRRFLEPEAAALASQHIRRSDVAALRGICARGQRLALRKSPDFELLAALNRKLHLTILAASGNTAIERIVAGILDLLAENMQDWFSSREQALTSWAPDGEHRRIVESIARGDAETVRSLMAEHIQRH